MAHTQSLKALQRKIRELRQRAEKLEQAERPGINELRAVLRKFKLGPADVKTAMSNYRGGRRSKLKGRKVPVKYRNPDRVSDVWTGRGRMPTWMSALVKNGRKREDFLIERF